MFCMKCGSIVDDGLRFCTKCGASLDDDMSGGSSQYSKGASFEYPIGFSQVDASGLDVMTTLGGYGDSRSSTSGRASGFASVDSVRQAARTDRVSEKQKKKKGKGKLIAFAILLILVLVAAIGVTIYVMQDKADDVEVFYASDVKVKVSPDSIVIAHNKSEEPLEKYDVTIHPEDVSEELSWDEASISVEGDKGFSIGDFGDIPQGTYSLEIVDTTTKNTEYWCPQIEVVKAGSEEAANTVLLKADPDNPKSATSKPPAEYDFESATSEVEFVYHGSEDYMQVDEIWTYVQFSCTQESEVINELNAAIKQAFDEELQASKDWSMETSTDEQCVIHRESIVRFEGSFASVRQERYVTMWGAHGGSVISGTTYNLETGVEVTPESLLNLTTEEMQGKAREALNAYYQANPSDIFTASDVEAYIEDLIMDPERYYVAEEGVVFVVNPYELGSNAFGGREIVIAAFEDESLVATDVKGKYSEIA